MSTALAHPVRNTVGRRILAPVLSEISLQCSDGMTIAAQSWTSSSETNSLSRRILALHGWMDNSNSFQFLGPRLAVDLKDISQFVALDLIGHGHSSHKSRDGPSSSLAEGAFYVAEAVEQLNWRNFVLIGHSMGASISCLYAAAFPEQVEQLILLDGAGPIARPPLDVAKHVRSHVQRRMQQQKEPRLYDFEQAIAARQATAQSFPGQQYLSYDAARALVQRGTTKQLNGQYQFVHDPRLQLPSLQYFTNEQVEGVYRDISCPTCMIRGIDGWPFDEESMRRVKSLLKPKTLVTLPGSHHLHADPDTADAVANTIVDFLEEQDE